MRTYLEHVFPGRLQFHDGKSKDTLAAFRAENPSFRCDVFVIDGSHVKADVSGDIADGHALSHNETVVLIDDVQVRHGQPSANPQLILTASPSPKHCESSLPAASASNVGSCELDLHELKSDQILCVLNIRTYT